MDRQFSAQASWLELDGGALRANVAALREVVGEGVQFGAVVKGNAYGHGLSAIVPAVAGLADVLYAITPQDALAIREITAKPVLTIGAASAEEVAALTEAGVDVVVSSADFAATITDLRERKLDRRARVHIHVDTGLGREGFTPTQIDAAAAMLRAGNDVVEVVGVLSHFANTEDVTEQGYALSQIAAFDAASARLSDLLEIKAPLQRHLAASAAGLVLPKSRYDVVRFGIALYGLWPSTETRLSTRLVLGRVPTLRPVLSWRCRSQLVKWLEAGSFVGYGCTYRCSERTRVAVLPVGYFDGYPRLLSGRAHVLVNGHRCPVLGRVMMNHLVVDVTRAAPEAPQVTATLLGADGNESLTAETLADWAQTIHYELVTRIGPHLRRVVT